MSLFSINEQADIARAITEAEKNTAGEIVCVVARSASDYRAVPILWAAIAAFALPWPLLRFTTLAAEMVHLIQLGAFIGLALLLLALPWRMALVPKVLKRRRARRAAHEQFFVQEMVRTAGRTGCLIYVAEAERYAEVLADSGIASKVDPAIWQRTVEALTDGLRAGRAAEGMIRAIGICGTVLADHCPPVPNDRDELPNRLILL